MNASTFVFLRLIRMCRLHSAFIPTWWGCKSIISTYSSPVRPEKMKACLASSIRLSYIGVESIFLNSSRLIYLCLASGLGLYSKLSQGGHADNFLIDRQIQQTVRPTQAMVRSGSPEILAFLQIGSV